MNPQNQSDIDSGAPYSWWPLFLYLIIFVGFIAYFAAPWVAHVMAWIDAL
ncbi:MAG: hypothetical protein ABIT70_08340 [Sulfuriferula sp.]